MALKSLLLFTMFFLNACSATDKHTIATIPEASGICYWEPTNSLYVANDEGRIYEISTTGKILRKKRLGKYDLEGVTCDTKNNHLLFAVEGKDAILVVNPKTLTPQREIDIKRSFHKKKVLKKDKKNGLEGITLVDGSLYVSNQSKKRYPKTDASVVLKIGDLERKKIPILALIDPKHTDIAGLAYYQGKLYMVSDSEDLLIAYNLKKQKIEKEIKLPSFAQEGIAFDREKHIYFADDKGRVLKYKKSDFGL